VRTRIVRQRQSCLAKTTRKRAKAYGEEDVDDPGGGVAGIMKCLCPGSDFACTVTTRQETPGGNDQREGIQHNILRVANQQSTTPKVPLRPTRQSYIFIVSSNASISNDISISPNEESLGSSSIISEASPSSSGCAHFGLEGTICISDGLDFIAE
jgi:hypothetical protein